ncbi:MAG: protease SohB [Planctomycetota bacterium]
MTGLLGNLGSALTLLAADAAEKAAGGWSAALRDTGIELTVFLLKAIIVGGAAVFIVSMIASLFGLGREASGGGLSVTLVNDALEQATDLLRDARFTNEQQKVRRKERKKRKKAERKQEKQAAKQAASNKPPTEPAATEKATGEALTEGLKPVLFLLDFAGDIAATQVTKLRIMVTALVEAASPGDEVLVRLESGGGLVSAYGLAASQLARIKAKGLKLTVSVDKVAASGGYLMACEADEIVTAPFAVIGSIGVIAPVPNLHRLLERYGVDYEELTAGRFKRTVSLLAEISEEGRQKFLEQLEETHDLFKGAVAKNRPDLDIDLVSTGEHWFGQRALELHLIDRVQTSDDFIVERLKSHKVLHLHYEQRTLRGRIARTLEGSVERFALRWLGRLNGPLT